MSFQTFSLWRYISRFIDARHRRDRDRLDTTDLAIIEPICMEYQERFLVEGGTFVGATGTVVADHVVQTSVKLPTGLDPKFNEREADILKVACATCYIVARNGNRFCTATAFFINSTTLLTAGHAVHAVGETLWAQIPGMSSVEPDPQTIWDGTAPCIQLSVVAKHSHIDLAVLRTTGTRGWSCAPLDFHQIYQNGEILDLIGYPGAYDVILINRLHGKDVSDVSSAYTEAKSILPKWKLTVTCGKIISTGDNPQYNLSTIGGMSGGPVIYRGNVIGADTLGIHIGWDKVTKHNNCIAFSSQRVKGIVEGWMRRS